MKATTAYKKLFTALYAVMLTAVLILGALFALAPVTARAEEPTVTESEPRALYFVDAGYLVNSDGSIASRGGSAQLCTAATPFMKTYDLAFGDGNGNGLYNSLTDRNLYELGGGDIYNLDKIVADPVTGKYWGTYCTDGRAYGWEWWRRGKTTSSTPGFETARYIHENSSDPEALYYDFEVDDDTTPLKVIVGTRRVSEGDQSASNDGQIQINNLTAQKIEGKDQDLIYTFSEGITGIEKTMQAMTEAKPFVTLKIGANKKITHIAWILICTADYELPVSYSYSSFIKKNSTTMTAVPSDNTPNITANITPEGQAAINEADYLTEVEFGVSLTTSAGEQKNLKWKATVLPGSTQKFINLGASESDGIAEKGETSYNETAKHGELSSTGDRTAGWQSDAYFKSCLYGNKNTTLQYRIDGIAPGAYSVVVGTYGHWSVSGRKQTVSANDGAKVDLVGSANAMAYETCYCAVDDSGRLDVTVESEQDANNAYLVTFILVYEANTVTFDTHGGSSIPSLYFESGSTVQLPTDAPTRSGYEFLGWFSQAEGGEKVTQVSGNATVHAQWKACEFDWDNAEWGWNGVTAAGLTAHCPNCNQSMTLTATIGEPVITAEATCTESGEATYTASVTVSEGVVKTDSKTIEIKAKGHEFAVPTQGDWSEWDSENNVAYLTLHCTRAGCTDPDHPQTAEITSKQEGASCTEGGTITFTATVEFNGETYTKDYVETGDGVPPLGHLFAAPQAADWTWNGEGEVTATVSLHCTREGCDHSENKDADEITYVTTATCTQSGRRTYTAKVTVNNIEYRCDYEVDDAALGHSGELKAQVAATCTEHGSIEHYECANCGNKFAEQTCETALSDEQVNSIAPLGHNYETDNLVWNWLGYGSASVHIACTRCDHSEDLTATVTNEVTKAATETADGERKYTATVTINGADYTDVKTETIPKTGAAPKPADETEKEGCGGSAAASAAVAAVALLFAAAIAVARRKYARK